MSESEPIYTGNFDFGIHLKSYGVNVRIEANTRELLDAAKNVALEALVDNAELFEIQTTSEHSLGVAEQDDVLFLFRNGKQLTCGKSRYAFFKYLDSMIRVTVAEFAPNHVFLHAGAVGINGKGLIMPGDSFQGKTTLVSELVKKGAEYYSDEYAILDSDGNLHPFARNLSVRHYHPQLHNKEVPVELLGGTSGKVPIQVGMVLLTEFREGAVWHPKILSIGQGIMETVPQTIPVRVNTEFSLKVLNKAFNRAIIAKSHRGDASNFASTLMAYFNNCISKTSCA